MAKPSNARNLFEADDDTVTEPLPPLFAEALAEVRAAIDRCDKAGIPKDTMVAAMMTEAMPCLVEVYGHQAAASALDELARELSAESRPNMSIQ